MNKAAERDLISLLPSITLPLPRELLELTTSLFSQSKNKASSLKQDEEIARGYVCANIACNRLKVKLNLPPIVVRPPVNPKNYKRVYAYLESALSSGTPRKQANGVNGQGEPSTPSKSRVQSVDGTPSKAKSTPSRTPAKTPTTKPSSGKRKRHEVEQDGQAPDWTMPAIRSLCRVFKIPAAAPHAFVGVASILKVIRDQQATIGNTPAKKRARRSSGTAAPSEAVAAFEDVHIPALIAVVAMYTLSHLTSPPDPNMYEKLRQKAIDALLKVVPEDFRQEQEGMVGTIELMLREAQNGWLEMEWYQNLPESDLADELREVPDSLEGAENEEEEEDRAVDGVELPKRGFGTMMTDATDWLSEERRAEYKRWKAGIMKRIARIEKEQREAVN